MATLILTVIGDDRPGLVSALSAPIESRGANWERSRMARLAGKFAGIVLVTVSEERLGPLIADLEALDPQVMQVFVERTDSPVENELSELRLELFGTDHPGIVAEVTASLATRGVSIEELSTDVRDSPMGGGTVFEAQALLSAPTSLSIEELRSMLETLAHDLMVEISLAAD